MLLRMKQMPHQFSYIISMVVMLSLDLIFSFFLINRKRTGFSIFSCSMCLFDGNHFLNESFYHPRYICGLIRINYLAKKSWQKILTFQIKQIKNALSKLHSHYHQFISEQHLILLYVGFSKHPKHPLISNFLRTIFPDLKTYIQSLWVIRRKVPRESLVICKSISRTLKSSDVSIISIWRFQSLADSSISLFVFIFRQVIS